MSQCTGTTAKLLDKSVICDTWRCNQIEKQYAPYVKVHTCNVLEDILRPSDMLTNINCSCNSNQFLHHLIDRKWKFKEIYMDNFRMPDSYLRDKISDNFIKNLIKIAKSGHLMQNGVVFLPFNPRMFNLVHSPRELLKKYELT